MKSTLKAVVAMALVLFLFTRCSQIHKERAPSEEKKETAVEIPMARSQQDPTLTLYASSPAPSLTSSAAVENKRDSTHSFIRTADIKCKVTNVPGATYAIEDITRQLGGYVSYTNLTSTIDVNSSSAVSADSSLQTSYYTVQNSMIIRVPNTNLDSALKAITPLVAHLDFRVIKANDAVLQMLANKLKQQRIAKHEDRLNRAIDEHGKKLSETASAEDGLLDKQEQADNAKIDNLSLNDQVKFSTINLALYQPQAIERTMVYNEKSMKPYEAGLVLQLKEAAQFGLSLFEELLVIFVKLWPLTIGGILIFIGYRRLKLKVA